MTEQITIIVPGKPIGKGRPRFARLPNGKMLAYTPAKTRAWESIVHGAAVDAMNGQERSERPITVEILAVVEEPAGWPAWKRGRVLPTTRPDCDNILKAACDSLSGVVWKDDSLVVDKHIRKVYGSAARLEITVTFLDALSAQVKTKKECEAYFKERRAEALAAAL